MLAPKARELIIETMRTYYVLGRYESFMLVSVDDGGPLDEKQSVVADAVATRGFALCGIVGTSTDGGVRSYTHPKSETPWSYWTMSFAITHYCEMVRDGEIETLEGWYALEDTR